MITIPKRLILIDTICFEKWDWRNPDTLGIGNSETCQIELAWRMARRGWEVISYAPLPENCDWDRQRGKHIHKGVEWRDIKYLDPDEAGFWMIFRQPDLLDKFNKHPDQWLSVLCQDSDYGTWSPDRAAKLDQVIALCETQKIHLETNHPELRGKVMVSSNAVRPELVREVLADPPERNPHRMMWATSPDRGLLRLAKIFKRLSEWVPDAELHVFYGWDNYDKAMERRPQMRMAKEAMMNELQHPGVIIHGRVPQPELYREWAKSAIMCYPTMTCAETSCASLMEAQALGCIPVVSPVWALGENAWHGTLIEGDPEDPLVSARFVGEIYRWMSDPKLQELCRPKMMVDMLVSRNWERVCDQWETMFLDLPNNPGTHYIFQLKHATGKVLNIGCDEDPCAYGERGATNVDITDTNPVLKYKTKAHVIADVRLRLPLNREYDTVILGDVIEHLELEEIPAAIHNAAACVKKGGKLIVGFPDDTRSIEEQSLWHNANGTEHYGHNSHALHTHRMDIEHVKGVIQAEGMAIETVEQVDYGTNIGWGILSRWPEGKETA